MLPLATIMFVVFFFSLSLQMVLMNSLGVHQILPVDALNMKKAITCGHKNGFTNEMLKCTYLPKTITAATVLLLCKARLFLTVYSCQDLYA